MLRPLNEKMIYDKNTFTCLIKIYMKRPDIHILVYLIEIKPCLLYLPIRSGYKCTTGVYILFISNRYMSKCIRCLVIDLIYYSIIVLYLYNNFHIVKENILMYLKTNLKNTDC